MKKQFTPYEMSVKLKELGFNEKCFDVYSDVKSVGMFRNSPRDRTQKILWQQAFDWLFNKFSYLCVINNNISYEEKTELLSKAIRDIQNNVSE